MIVIIVPTALRYRMHGMRAVFNPTSCQGTLELVSATSQKTTLLIVLNFAFPTSIKKPTSLRLSHDLKEKQNFPISPTCSIKDDLVLCPG